MNVTLIGMPGSGKSHVGRLVAKRLGYELVDIDAILEAAHGAALPAVVAKLGDSRFVEDEADAAVAATTGKDGLVISPGGSVVYSERAMSHLAAVSTVVFLDAPLATIRTRIGGRPRGIVGGGKSLRELFAERAPLYRKWAKLTVDADQSAGKVAEAVVRAIGL